ncbi:MAG TPA: substrate-binding domain-containing protein [Gemmataceae bacterium]|nr:substrate-binding domain-containing protein [Gemmataceae bacterium]
MLRWLYAGAVVALLLAGCADPKEYKYRVAVIPKGLTHEFWQSIHRGAEHAAIDLEREHHIPVKIVWDGPLKENDALDQIRIVDRRIANRVDAIVLAPQHSQIMLGPVERAVAHKIPVVIIDSGLADESLITKYVATDNYHGGELAAQHLLDLLHKDGKTDVRLILLRYEVGSESTDKREKGFEDYIDHQTTMHVTWLSRDKYAGATMESAKREADPLIARLKDQGIDGIFAPNESSTNGMLNALRGQGLGDKLKKGEIKLMGFDSSEPLLQAVENGEIHGLILQDPYRMGYLGTWTAVWKLEGHDVTPGGPKDKDFSTGEYFVDKHNLPTERIQGLFDPAVQVQRHIELPPFLRSASPKP